MNLRTLLSLGFLAVAIGGCAIPPHATVRKYPEPKTKQARAAREVETAREHRALYPSRSRRSLLLARYPLLRQTVRSGGTV